MGQLARHQLERFLCLGSQTVVELLADELDWCLLLGELVLEPRRLLLHGLIQEVGARCRCKSVPVEELLSKRAPELFWPLG